MSVADYPAIEEELPYDVVQDDYAPPEMVDDYTDEP